MVVRARSWDGLCLRHKHRHSSCFPCKVPQCEASSAAVETVKGLSLKIMLSHIMRQDWSRRTSYGHFILIPFTDFTLRFDGTCAFTPPLQSKTPWLILESYLAYNLCLRMRKVNCARQQTIFTSQCSHYKKIHCYSFCMDSGLDHG